MKKFFRVAVMAFAALAVFASASPSLAVSAEAIPDSTVAETYRLETGVIAAPTVVCDVTTREIFDALREETSVLPSNAILHVDGNGNAVTSSGESLGSVEEIYTGVLRGKVIPVLCVSDRAGAEAVVRYFKDVRALCDAAVMSGEPALVKYVRTEVPQIRGILSFSETADPFEIVKTVNSSYANVAVLPLSLATRETVDFIQARFKTVWVAADGEELSLQRAIFSGAYGLVTGDPLTAYGVLAGDFPKGLAVRTRMPYNVAHRGMGQNGTGASTGNEYHENSVSSCKAALAAGATHLEVDAYVTTDDAVVIMHDNDIARTTNGSGHVESFSYDELMEFDLDLAPVPEKIPTLEQILDVVRGTETVLVLEIKTEQTDKFLAAFQKRVQEKSEREGYDFWRQIVVISFQTEVLIRMREILPEVPTADLNSVGGSDADLLRKLCEWNTGVDAPASEALFVREEMLRARGIVGWYWTYGSFVPNATAPQGLTNNDPRADGIVRYVRGKEGVSEEDGRLAVGSEVPLEAVEYDGSVHDVVGSVAYLKRTADGYYALAQYDSDVGTFYADISAIEKRTPEDGSGGEQKDEGCGSALSLSLLLPFALLPLALLRKKEK